MLNNILSIAGSDSSGGAGIQADIATISKLGGIAMTALTAVTSQDHKQVYDIHYLPNTIIKSQMEAVIDKAQSIKTGMLCNATVIKTIAPLIPANVPLILDPVMVSTSGHTLLEPAAIQIMTEVLFKMALIITPNIPEAELLIGEKINNHQEMVEAGKNILSSGAKAVLMKGGHLIKDKVITDILVTPNQIEYFRHDAINTSNTHGTGCKLSAALAYYITNHSIADSVQKAIDHVISTLK